MAAWLVEVISKLLGPLSAWWNRKKRQKRLNVFRVQENSGERYFTWRGRGDVHLIEREEPPRQLFKFYVPLCQQLREHSGMVPEFCLPERINGEVVYEVSADFKAKWRLLGGSGGAAGQQVLVLVPPG